LAPDDVCLVKLIVGPGHSGPTGAPSTSAGIGIEIWLPSAVAWNHRVHAKGGAGWAGGGAYGSTLAIGDVSAGLAAASEHAVTVTSDAGTR
jgi:feruloyl esterase